MIKQSESIKELAAALAEAQSTMEHASKDASNPFFKSKYADLPAVIQAIKEPFSCNGLSYVQFPVHGENSVGVCTRLMHKSGEWLESEYMLPMVKNDPQAAGSAITYARRYSLQAIAGISAEDDDGEKAMNRAASKMITTEQAASIKQRLQNTNSDVKKFLSAFGITNVDSMPESYYPNAIKLLDKKAAA